METRLDNASIDLRSIHRKDGSVDGFYFPNSVVHLGVEGKRFFLRQSYGDFSGTAGHVVDRDEDLELLFTRDYIANR
jgi:hypothetical protein